MSMVVADPGASDPVELSGRSPHPSITEPGARDTKMVIANSGCFQVIARLFIVILLVTAPAR
jgi:hypothetical protein